MDTCTNSGGGCRGQKDRQHKPQVYLNTCTEDATSGFHLLLWAAGCLATLCAMTGSGHHLGPDMTTARFTEHHESPSAATP